MAHSDEPISVIEDLDPEPSSRRGGRQVWEVVLGLLLLAGVLGYVGWQWVRQDAQQRTYDAASDAATRHDWDQAHALFAAASGYLDADRQATAAATTMAKRDDLYKLALDNENAGNWVAGLKTIRQVEDIQPGYKDSAQIERLVTGKVYQEALSGTVALRPDATPPGLYYYSPGGWAWLPNSDLYSRVQGSGSGDWLVYDVPGAGWTPRPGATQPGPVTGSPQLQDRRLMAVQPSDLPRATAISIPIDPSRYSLFQWGKEGLWMTSYDPQPTQYPPPGPIRLPLFGSEQTTVTYQSFTNAITSTTHVESAKDKAIIMSLDPNSNRYLLATWSGEDSNGGVISSTATTLYLVRPGSDRQLLYSITGGSFTSAQFSPDGLHALLSTYTPLDAENEKQDYLLLSLNGKAAPQEIAETTAHINNESPDHADGRLTASFIDGGSYSGDVIVAEYDQGHNYLRLIDTQWGTAAAPLIVMEVPNNKRLYWSIFEGHGGEAVLVATQQPFMESLRQSQPFIQPMPITFVVLAPDEGLKVTSLVIDWDPYRTGLEFATIAGNEFVFSTFTCCSLQNSRSVFAFPATRFGVQGERPPPMYSQTGTASSDSLLSDGSQSFGPSLFAYISAGALHARFYDGSLDVLLEQDVTYLYTQSESPVWQSALR
jgi:hypothetical protein